MINTTDHLQASMIWFRPLYNAYSYTKNTIIRIVFKTSSINIKVAGNIVTPHTHTHTPHHTNGTRVPIGLIFLERECASNLHTPTCIRNPQTACADAPSLLRVFISVCVIRHAREECPNASSL